MQEAQAHVLAYRDYIGMLWMTGQISQSECERLTGRKILRRLA